MRDDIPEYVCAVCGLPSNRLSYGGPGICPACDCGVFRNGHDWSYKDVMLTVKDAPPDQQVEFRRRAARAAMEVGP